MHKQNKPTNKIRIQSEFIFLNEKSQMDEALDGKTSNDKKVGNRLTL